jgi:hypothetical protein
VVCLAGVASAREPAKMADLSVTIATLKSSADAQRPQSVNAAMATPVAMSLTSDATSHPGISRFNTEPRIPDAS